ncbi:MAG: YdjY domain-containing protein [Aeoliella sp.]
MLGTILVLETQAQESPELASTAAGAAELDASINTDGPTPKPPPQLPPPEGAKQLSKTDQAWIDPEHDWVIVDGRVSLRRGVLEMFACTKNTKEHESIVAVDSKAFVLHAALLAAGAEPGGPVEFTPKYVPPHGTRIEVEVYWLDEQGQRHKARAQNWVRDVRTKEAMDLPWVFAGSGFWRDEETGQQGYMAEGGDLICVSNFGSAMLDVPAELTNSNEGLFFEAFTEKIPPLGWPVRLVLKPVLEEEESKDKAAANPRAAREIHKVEKAVAKQFDWPQWLGPQRNGLTEETGLLKEWPSKGPRQMWLSREIGLGYAGPAIAGGTLFIMGTRGEASYLFALNADTGSELWAVEMGSILKNGWGDGPRSTPTVDGDRVYALAAGGVLVCCNTASGAELWRVTMQDLGGGVPTWGYAESPLVDGDLLLCTPGGSKGAIAALDKMTGNVRWQSAEVTDGAHYSSIVKGAAGGKSQYIQLLAKRAIGLNPADGRLLWESPFPGSTAVIPTPIYRDNKVYLTAGYGAGSQLLDLGDDGQTVTQPFNNKVMKNQHGGVILIGDHLYGHSDGVGWVCQDWNTGEKVWNNKRDLGKGAIGYADGMLYCISEKEGEVVLIEATPEEWREQGRFTLSPQTEQRSPRGRIWVHPVIVNGKLYLRDQELLFCFDVKAP